MQFPPTWHALIFGGVLVGLAVLVILTQEALAPYIIGLILIFLMNGLVDRLQRAGVPRWGGTLIAILALIVAVAAFAYFILDALIEQLSALIVSLPEITSEVTDWLLSLGLPESVEAALAGWFETLPAAIPDLLAGVFGFVVSGVGGVVALVVAWAGIPFFIFYALSDSPKLLSGLRAAVPGSFRASVFAILKILGDVFGAWARGTAIIAGIVFVPFVIGFYVFGILIDPDIGDYALLFAATLALSELIPIIGPILALIPILVITAVIAGLPGVIAVGRAVRHHRADRRSRGPAEGPGPRARPPSGDHPARARRRLGPRRHHGRHPGAPAHRRGTPDDRVPAAHHRRRAGARPERRRSGRAARHAGRALGRGLAMIIEEGT